MDEIKTFLKAHWKTIVAVITVLLIVYATWFLFQDIRSDGRAADDTRTELNNTATEQQRTQESLESIGNGLDDSQSTVGRIEQSNSAAQSTAAGIAESNKHIAESISGAQTANSRGKELTQDSERRISESLSIIQSIRKGT